MTKVIISKGKSKTVYVGDEAAKFIANKKEKKIKPKTDKKDN